METIQDKYIPGVCNIGPEEIKKRKVGISILSHAVFMAAL